MSANSRTRSSTPRSHGHIARFSFRSMLISVMDHLAADCLTNAASPSRRGPAFEASIGPFGCLAHGETAVNHTTAKKKRAPRPGVALRALFAARLRPAPPLTARLGDEPMIPAY